MALNDDTLTQLREKHGTSEPSFIKGLGYGFDALTESEARQLLKWKPADAVRNRFLEAGSTGVVSDRENLSQGTPGAEGWAVSRSLAPTSWEQCLFDYGQETTNPETQETSAVSASQGEAGNQCGRTTRGRRGLNDLHHHA